MCGSRWLRSGKGSALRNPDGNSRGLLEHLHRCSEAIRTGGNVRHSVLSVLAVLSVPSAFSISISCFQRTFRMPSQAGTLQRGSFPLALTTRDNGCTNCAYRQKTVSLGALDASVAPWHKIRRIRPTPSLPWPWIYIQLYIELDFGVIVVPVNGEAGKFKYVPVAWEGDSREILKAFPEDVQRNLGFQLWQLQQGEDQLVADRYRRPAWASLNCGIKTRGPVAFSQLL